jgi:drug/metabolite transporter (DMT)-like permease
VREAAKHGISTGEVKVDLGPAQERSRQVADQMNRGVEFLVKKNKIVKIIGFGRLTGEGKVEVESTGGEKEQYSAKHIILAMGVVGLTVFNALFYLAAHETTAVNIGILQGAMPVLVLLGSVVFFHTKLGAFQVAGVAITIAGVALVVSQGDLAVLAALEINRGDLFMLLASLCYAAYALGLRNRPQVSPISLLTIISTVAAIATLPLAMTEALMGRMVWPSLYGWAVVAYVTVFPSVMAQLFFINGVGLIGPARAGVFINLVPVFAAILAVAILGEALRWYHVGGLAFVLSGIWLAERRAI